MNSVNQPVRSTKQLSINLIASVASFIINLGISFFLTFFIIENIGVEANGFVGLGTSFINYAALVTIALNSMAGRYITIAIHKNNWESANTYFNSVLIANLIMAAVIFIPSLMVVVYLEKFINVPAIILFDVKMLFALLFMNYMVSIVISTFAISTFATNKLYKSSMRKIESTFIRAILLVMLFTLFQPSVYYVGLVSLIVTLYIGSFDFYYLKKYLPKINFNKSFFNLKAIVELIASGIWNTVTKLGQILLNGLDLMLANLYISSIAMGNLAVVNTLITAVGSLIITVASVFAPEFTLFYAKEDKRALEVSIKRSMKILGVITNIPVVIFVVLGRQFFRLWVPSLDNELLYILLVMQLTSLVITGPINTLYSIFTITNKVRSNSLVIVLTGLLNIGIVGALLSNTNLGLYAIAGVSVILLYLRSFFFTIPFSAYYLRLKWTEFYPVIFKNILIFAMATSFAFLLTSNFQVNSWLSFLTVSALIGFSVLILNLFVVLNTQERQFFVRWMLRK